jgi:hypothetical protein
MAQLEDGGLLGAWYKEIGAARAYLLTLAMYRQMNNDRNSTLYGKLKGPYRSQAEALAN